MGYMVWNGKDYLREEYCRGGYSLTTDKNKAFIWKTEEKAKNTCIAYKKKYGNLKPLYVEDKQDTCGVPADLDFDILDKSKELACISKQLEERICYLGTQLSDADKEISDIEHAAEFYNLNASQGYKIYRMLHDVTIRRRNIKDEMEKIKYILGTPLHSADMENVSKSIIGLDSRKYRPRINKELFGV